MLDNHSSMRRYAFTTTSNRCFVTEAAVTRVHRDDRTIRFEVDSTGLGASEPEDLVVKGCISIDVEHDPGWRIDDKIEIVVGTRPVRKTTE